MPSGNLREIRTMRIEDWMGNVYKPEGVGSGGSGGSSIGGNEINTGGTGINTSEGTQIGDPNANGSTSIIITAPPAGSTKNAATVHFDDVSFGNYAVNLRIKCSRANISDEDILTVNVYYVDNTEANPVIPVSQTKIKEHHFKAANRYIDIGFATEFYGIFTTSMSMRVEILINGGSGVTITLDTITVAKAFVAVTGTSTIISRIE